MNKMGESSSLLEFIDLDELQAIQDSFAKTVGISSVIFSPEGEPLTRFSYPTGFCSLIQSTEEGKRRCFLSVKEMSRKAIKLKKPKILYCFAHGGHFVAPIIINDEHKGTMFAGQFIPQNFSPKQLKALEKTAVEINLEPQLLTKEAKEMCVIEEDVVEFYSSLLFQIVEFFGRLGAKAAELNQAQDALRKARDALEVRVHERTAELANSNEQLKREIIKRKRAEEELREEKAFTESALNSLLDNFAIVDLEGRFIRWNKRVNEVTGYSDKEISSVKITDLFREEDTKRLLAGMERAMKGEQARDEVTLVTKDGRHIPYELFGSLIKDSNGKPVGICGIGRDITERKKAEEELQKSMAELERFNRLAKGSELRMIELKQEVNQLYERLGEKPPYDLSFVGEKTINREL